MAAAPSFLASLWGDALGSSSSRSSSSNKNNKNPRKAKVAAASDHHEDDLPCSTSMRSSSSSSSSSSGTLEGNMCSGRQERQARLAANMQVREEEASTYIAHKALLPLRRQQALKRRLVCYLLSLPFLLLGGSVIPSAFSASAGSSNGVSRMMAMVLCLLFLCVSVLCVLVGYVAGEGWRKGGRTMTEAEMREKIEIRAAEILREKMKLEGGEEDEEEDEDEKKRKEEVEREGERRRREEEEEMVRAIEREVGGREGGRKGRKGGRKGSVSSTDIKVTEEVWTKVGGKEDEKEGGEGEKAVVVVEVGEAGGGVKEWKLGGREGEGQEEEGKEGKEKDVEVLIAARSGDDVRAGAGVWV